MKKNVKCKLIIFYKSKSEKCEELHLIVLLYKYIVIITCNIKHRDERFART